MRFQVFKRRTDYGTPVFLYRPETTDLDTIKKVAAVKKDAGEYNQHIPEGFLTKDDIILDLGGHIGSFAVRFAMQFGCKVISYEPSEDNFNLLKRNIELNKLGETVAVRNFAVTHNEDMKIPFYLTKKKGTGMHSVLKKRGRTKVLVDNKNIKDVLRKGITCLKLDIEGAEFGLLKGIDSFSGIRLILLEYHHSMIRDANFPDKYKQIVRLLKKNFKKVYYDEKPKKSDWKTQIVAVK